MDIFLICDLRFLIADVFGFGKSLALPTDGVLPCGQGTGRTWAMRKRSVATDDAGRKSDLRKSLISRLRGFRIMTNNVQSTDCK